MSAREGGDAVAPTEASSTVIDGLGVPVPLKELGPDEVIAGSPSAGLIELGSLTGVGYGVWEMSEGTASDVEADELFVVLAGSATVDIEPFGDAPGTRLELRPGSVVRLFAGMRTAWTVHETLRKVWIAPAED